MWICKATPAPRPCPPWRTTARRYVTSTPGRWPPRWPKAAPATAAGRCRTSSPTICAGPGWARASGAGRAARWTVKCCSAWGWTRCTGAWTRARAMSPCTGCGGWITATAVTVWSGVAAPPTPCAPAACWRCRRWSSRNGGSVKYAGWPGSATRYAWAWRCCPRPCGRCVSAPATPMPGRRRRCWCRPRKVTIRRPWWCPPPATAAVPA